MKTIDLLNARRNVYSQNGEDGVLELLMDFFDIQNGSFCEFGAWDGKFLSNTYNLLENKNWKGVYIEGDPEKYNDLLKLKDEYGDRVQTIQAYVDYEGIDILDNLLANTFLEKDFDLLSIDVDGMDYHIWKSLIEYKPKFVIIEVNSNFGSNNIIIQSKTNSDHITGSSFGAVCELGIEKGYYPIVHFGNVFLARKDILKSKNYDMNPTINSLFTW